jgi:hypothetical protein
MNPLIRLVVLLAIAAGGVYFGLTAYQKLKLTDQNSMDLDRIRQEYLERQNWVNAVPEPDHYRDERSSLEKWYFGELTSHYNRFPTFRDYYRVGEELAKSGKKEKGSKKDDLSLRQEYYDLTKSVWDQLKDGSYAPEFSAGSNSLRLDIYKVGRKTDDGKPVLRFDMVLWGAQRHMEREQSAAGGTNSRMITAAQFQAMHFKMVDDEGKIFAEMDVTGDPPIKVDYPERWIEEFPPQAVIGYYEVDPLPAKPVKAEITINISSRSATGNDIPGTFTFSMPIPAEWKLAPGESWQGATTEERPKDYIDQKAN